MWKRTPDGSGAVVTHSWTRQPSCPGPRVTAARVCSLHRVRAGEGRGHGLQQAGPDAARRSTAKRASVRAFDPSWWFPWGARRRIRAPVERWLFGSTTTDREWTPATIEQMQLAAAVVGQALERKATVKALQHALDEVRHLRRRLSGETPVTVAAADGHEGRPPGGSGRRRRGPARADNCYLRRDAQERSGPGRSSDRVRRFAACSSRRARSRRPIRRCCCLARPAPARSSSPPQIHELSARRARAMVRVNCAAIPATLIESELFGREKGAYHRRARATDRTVRARATSRRSSSTRSAICPPTSRSSCCGSSRSGRSSGSGARRACTSTCASSPPRTGTSRNASPTGRSARTSSTGSTSSRSMCRRCASASRRHSAARLALRRRVLEGASASGSRRFDKENMVALQRYPWPGNIRELRNVVERAMIVATAPQLTIALPQRRRRPRAAASGWPTSRGSTSVACSRAPAGASAAWPAPPNGSACSRPRSRRAWRSWDWCGRGVLASWKRALTSGGVSSPGAARASGRVRH